MSLRSWVSRCPGVQVSRKLFYSSRSDLVFLRKLFYSSRSILIFLRKLFYSSRSVLILLRKLFYSSRSVLIFLRKLFYSSRSVLILLRKLFYSSRSDLVFLRKLFYSSRSILIFLRKLFYSSRSDLVFLRKLFYSSRSDLVFLRKLFYSSRSDLVFLRKLFYSSRSVLIFLRKLFYSSRSDLVFLRKLFYSSRRNSSRSDLVVLRKLFYSSRSDLVFLRKLFYSSRSDLVFLRKLFYSSRSDLVFLRKLFYSSRSVLIFLRKLFYSSRSDLVFLRKLFYSSRRNSSRSDLVVLRKLFYSSRSDLVFLRKLFYSSRSDLVFLWKLFYSSRSVLIFLRKLFYSSRSDLVFLRKLFYSSRSDLVFLWKLFYSSRSDLVFLWKLFYSSRRNSSTLLEVTVFLRKLFYSSRSVLIFLRKLFYSSRSDFVFLRKLFYSSRTAYVPEEEKEAALLDEDLDGAESFQEGEEPVAKFLCHDKDLLLKDRPVSADFHDSPNTADFSGQELDSESHLSESSDRMSDFESPPLITEDDLLLFKDPSNTLSLSSTFMAAADNDATLSGDKAVLSAAGSVADSLEKMKAIYTSFLNNSYWSTLNLNLSQPPVEKPPRSHSNSSCSSNSSCGSAGYDWHQTAIAKTFQQASQNHHNRLAMAQHPAVAVSTPSTEPSLFSTVQLYRQSSKLYGSIFTGASKFRCKDCSAAYDTLVELTVHMNETGHYRDDNHETDRENTKRWSKPRKRSLLEMEGKEDAQKVLKCMYCGHSFESLQDLSVHMIKTKHYQKVPLKEPVTPVAAKIFSSARKRTPIELDIPSSPDSNGEATPKPTSLAESDMLQKANNQYIATNNRYGHQNGASYSWQFESRKSQILKCMECGSSHDTLQELTAHMMVTGHFIKVTNSAIKKGKPIIEAASPVPISNSTAEEKFQSVPLAATTFSPPPASAHPPASISPTAMAVEIKTEDKEEECPNEVIVNNSNHVSRDKMSGDEDEPEEKFDISSKYTYLTEEDLDDSPKGGLDILKSLENTVTSAISKAQKGAPSWGGYPSIHAAYQLPNIMKLSLGNSGKNFPLKFMFPGVEMISAAAKSQSLISPPICQKSPLSKNNFHAMEELVKKVTEKVAKVEENTREPRAVVRSSPMRTTPSPCSSEAGDVRGESPRDNKAESCKIPGSLFTTITDDVFGTNHQETNEDSSIPEFMENGVESTATSPQPGSICGSTAVITDHLPPEQPFVNPLSALKSVMNAHLGKAAKPALPSLDPMSMLFKMSNNLAEKAAVAASTSPAQTKKSSSDHLDCYFYQQHPSNDQPIDLTKGKHADKNGSSSISVSPSSTVTISKASAAVASFMSTSPLRENALSDISDMLRNLTESQVVTKASTPFSSDIEGATQEEGEESSPAQKRKGRQSNWNPQHLLILQAQFASSLRQTTESKYVMADLSPQERMHISRFTGLSMTTISHWLANVKYQLRRTGGTKFLKNLDSGHPVFFCSDCASQIRSPSTYVSHLESHLGFRLRDLPKLSGEQLLCQINHQHQRHFKGLSEKLLSSLHPSSHPLPSSLPSSQTPSFPISLPSSLPSADSASASPNNDEDAGVAVHQCKLCNRTFASKHAVKLHLSKTHGKSPEDHLLYVGELDKQ
ncbi:teashirt homolog 3-like [Nerophis ophidion]|uniref:teashirt homolog 3-like n=1 Tax=Nerophis ophidion TaxID=159077 RepID=UPI002ADF63B9|nr:teashirt homolog 3-like [Nerophis ophidion]